MRTKKEIKNIAIMAAKILKVNPHLKYYQAHVLAREVLKSEDSNKGRN